MVDHGKECVAVLTVLYNDNGAVPCVGSDFCSEYKHTLESRKVLVNLFDAELLPSWS